MAPQSGVKGSHENQRRKLSWTGYRSEWAGPQRATVPDENATTQYLGQMAIEVRDEQNQMQLPDCLSGSVAAVILSGAPAWTGWTEERSTVQPLTPTGF